MSELRTQLDAARAEHRRATYPGDLSANVLADDDQPQEPLILRLFYGAGAVAAAAALTFGVMRLGSIAGTEPRGMREQLTALGDRVMSVPSRLADGWDLPDMRLPQMSRPSEFPQHLRMMSPMHRVRTPELPEKILPGEQDEAAVEPAPAA